MKRSEGHDERADLEIRNSLRPHLHQLQSLVPAVPSPRRRIELIDLDGSFGELRQDLELAAQSFDDFLQGGDPHIRLLFQL